MKLSIVVGSNYSILRRRYYYDFSLFSLSKASADSIVSLGSDKSQFTKIELIKLSLLLGVVKSRGKAHRMTKQQLFDRLKGIQNDTIAEVQNDTIAEVQIDTIAEVQIDTIAEVQFDTFVDSK